ncbi:hypothetical protein M440DRAFT_1404449 [Trichoderma longibrachiatum ATCC 18648]|uniref:Uncharacterized protein n=1 Tax=Trichoderma longibrachiatum ATCC 18648 TaxID=983965 RepID=A0A2T4BVX7_TRILO|nr:hypothetical protein M440DRAFT_1404449 [Trichoderma longibrachiatum ATCC 18648]
MSTRHGKTRYALFCFFFYGLFRAGWKPQIALWWDTTADNGPAEKGTHGTELGRNGWTTGLIFLGLRGNVAGTVSPLLTEAC